ncbi:hypothetical protein QYM39_02995 [Pediococcus pentosaceus]|uniref:hypothetical protein n=1 Tax=Pediococcus pentosaceus TaxID=1255 RepID=UPI00265A0B95|nr:hypothetical protein [Pediococcus pentosaceus]WKF71652.1 hypothetical protein QYM39_02995 [Pediococcus pentosaceus]
MDFLKRKYNVHKLVLFELIWTGLLIIFVLFNFFKRPISISTMSALFIPFFLVPIFLNDIVNRKNNLLLKFRNVVLVLAVISLVFWLVAMIGFLPNSSTVIDWGRIKVINGYFHVHYIAQGTTDFLGLQGIVRNTGIFVEAPMYSYVLSLALITDVFFGTRSKGYSKKSLLLMATIFTTTSSTGAILVILVIFSKIVFLSTRISKSIKVILLIFLLPIVTAAVSYIVKSKLDSNWYSSTSIRINDFVAGYQAWKNHWILGNGLNNYDAILQNMDYRRLRLNANDGFSTGLMEVLAYGGIIYGLYFLIPIVMLIKKDKKVFLVAGISFVLFTFTLVNSVFLWYIFISYFWAVLLNSNKGKLEV